MRQPTLLVSKNVCRSDTPEEFDSRTSNDNSSQEHPMSLSIDMSTSPFSDSPLDASMGDVCTSGPQATAATYASSDPYSASVSPFSYPAGSDPNLLTPVSSAASPPMQHRAKSGGPYDSPEELQQPTPPGSSKLFYGSYDMPNQTSSPMAIHPQVTESHFDMANFINASPTEPEVVPYFGAFGVSVSESPEHSERAGSLGRYPPFSAGSLADPLQVGGPDSQYPSTMVPDLASPNPTLFRPTRGSIIEDLKSTPLGHMGYPQFDGLPSDLSSPPIKRERAGSRVNNRMRKASKRREAARSTSGSGTPVPGPSTSLLNTPPNVVTPKTREPTLTFGEKASEEDHGLLDLRKANSDGKGKGMWDAITKLYGQKYDQKVQRAALQMKLSRAVCKHGIWPQHEIDRLIEAYNYDEEHKYARIIARMKEMGGGQVWDWKPPHIEAQLVKLGMEEPTMDEKSKTRRKNRMAQRKRSAAAAHPYIHTNPNGNGTVVDWVAMTTPPHASMLGHHPFGRNSMSGYELAGATTAGGPGSGDDYGTTTSSRIDQHYYPSDQENDVIEEIHNKYGGAESPEPEINNRLGITFPPNDLASASSREDDVVQQSKRVARQACDAMLAGSHYGTLPHLKV